MTDLRFFHETGCYWTLTEQRALLLQAALLITVKNNPHPELYDVYHQKATLGWHVIVLARDHNSPVLGHLSGL